MLQRLVDGELSHAERASMLRDMEDHPERWRDVALALIEDKVFHTEVARSELDTLVDFQGRTQTMPKLTPLTLQTEAIREESPISMTAPFQRKGVPFLSLAASIVLVVVGFVVGSKLNSFRSTVPMENLVKDGTLERTKESAPRMRWHEGTQDYEIPIQTVSSENDLQPPQFLPEDDHRVRKIQQELARRGLKLEVTPRLMKGKLDDGQQLVVPVADFNVRPYGQ